ncbi:MAG: hypothetical protein WA638_05575 [Candidatus Acidiferrales bacterium]
MLYGSPYKITGNYFEQQGSNPPSYNVQVGDTTIPPLGFTPTPGAITIDNNFMQCNLTVYPPAPIVVETSQVLDIERNSFSQCEHENIVDDTAGSSTAHIKMLGNISDAQPLAWITHTTGLVESDVDAIGTAENPGTPYFYGLGIDSQTGPSALQFRSGGANAWNLNASTSAFSVAFNAHTGENTLQIKPFGSQSFASVQSNYAMDAAEVIVTQSGGSATFDAGLGNTFELIMSANVTSAALANAQPGQWLDFIICQGGGGPWTFAWPSNVFGGGTVGTTAGDCSTQTFYVSGSNAWAAGPMLVNMTSSSASPSILAVSGTVPYFTGAWTNGNCLEAGGSPGLISVTSGACGTGGSGGSPVGPNNAVEFNSSGSFGGVGPPTGDGPFALAWSNSCSGGATTPIALQFGFAARTLSASDTVACTDVGAEEDMPASGPFANYALSLPTPTTLGNATFYTRVCNRDAAYSEVITPATNTIDGAATLTVAPNTCALIFQDPTSSSNWLADLSMATAKNLSGQLTTTSAASDALTIAGVTANSHCVFSAMNTAAAANIATSYISANSVTLTHTTTSGMIYDFVCTLN